MIENIPHLWYPRRVDLLASPIIKKKTEFNEVGSLGVLWTSVGEI